MDANEQIAQGWSELIQTGALVIEGLDEDGEPSYTFDMEVLKAVNPALYHRHLDEIDAAVLRLVDEGLMTLDFSNPDIGVELTDKGMQFSEDILAALNQT